MLAFILVVATVCYVIRQIAYLKRLRHVRHLAGDQFFCDCVNGNEDIAQLASDSIITRWFMVLRFTRVAHYRSVSYIVFRGSARWQPLYTAWTRSFFC